MFEIKVDQSSVPVEASLPLRISRELENDILSGKFQPGARLDERSLAERFGVSRTPIREALKELVSQELAEHRNRQGIFVTKISMSSVMELFELLAVLESAAARLAARRMDAASAEELMAVALQTKDAAVRQAAADYTEANARFHELIYDGCGNRPLEESIRQVRRRVAPYRTHIHRIAGRRELSAHEHVELAQLIARHEELAAADLMFLHLDIHRSEFRDFVVTLSRSLERQTPVHPGKGARV